MPEPTVRTARENRAAALAVLAQINDLFPEDEKSLDLRVAGVATAVQITPFGGSGAEQCQIIADILDLTADEPRLLSGGHVHREWTGQVADFKVQLRLFNSEPIHTGAECACGQIHLHGISPSGNPLP